MLLLITCDVWLIVLSHRRVMEKRALTLLMPRNLSWISLATTARRPTQRARLQAPRKRQRRAERAREERNRIEFADYCDFLDWRVHVCVYMLYAKGQGRGTVTV
jgi:hypothetical protein